MLKKNLVKTGFFILLMPITGINGEPKSSQYVMRPENYLFLNRVDTSISGKLDSLTTIASTSTGFAKKMADAPKIELNKHATKFVKTYLVREDEALTKVKARSKAYFIDTVFTKYKLPLELKYLAIIESDLKTSAVSKVGAKGMWQFMPQTARELGLKVTKDYDERKHVYKSTVAAAKYLKDLYAEFGDWLLVLAAYNGGPGTVYKAIKKSGSRNFWALQYFLPEESRGHVKRYIGTHYFFEGEGGLTTLTKAETINYLKALDAFKLTEEITEDASVAVNSK
jgi:membrane-bound lytic murein transglycosylase D